MVAALAALVAPALSAPRTLADTAPPPGVPATVTADALPTVQVDGIVWSQATVGDTVYAVGDFDNARPAGSAPGHDLIPRANILAYDLRSGRLIRSFNHALNGPARSVAVTPDGSTLVVGGNFTQVDGRPLAYLAAFDVRTGALRSHFAPSVNGLVTAVAAGDNAVWFGGLFTAVGGQDRLHVAAVTLAAGRPTPFRATIDDYGINAVAVARNRVVVGGRFTSVNHQWAKGAAILDAQTGASLPFPGDQVLSNGGEQAGTLSLKTDGRLVYGASWQYTGGHFEGTWAVDPATGQLAWANDCHGDTYDIAPIGPVLYVASHVHDCQAIDGFPNAFVGAYNQQWPAIAVTTAASTAYNRAPDAWGWDFSTTHRSTLLTFYPTFTNGSIDGQATWSVTGNARYVSYGGEFPSVNGVAQQGLVRFAISARAPDRMGPKLPAFRASAASAPAAGQPHAVHLAWSTQNWDPDNADLRYQVTRDNAVAFTSGPVTTQFWTYPSSPDGSWTDLGAAPGAHTYRVWAVDPAGNRQASDPITVTVP